MKRDVVMVFISRKALGRVKYWLAGGIRGSIETLCQCSGHSGRICEAYDRAS